MTEEQSIELFRHLNEALLLARDPGSIALIEAVKYHESLMAATSPVPAQALVKCGCDDPATCEDRDGSCPPIDYSKAWGVTGGEG